ncbi:MAG TPA: hypothetical protein VK886_00145 [Vicinamibacterales bacterium]|nr:hypothetical protein [Vicinamibacterales bacterium]
MLFTSGYAEPLEGTVLHHADLLAKPFTAHALLTRVRRALDR